MNPNIPTANALRYNPFFTNGPPMNTLRYYRNNVPEGISRLCDEIEDFVYFMNSNSDNLQDEDNMEQVYYFIGGIDEYITNLTYNHQLTESVKIMCMRRLNRTRELLMNVIEKYNRNNRKAQRKSKKSLKKKKARTSSKSKQNRQVGGKSRRRNK